MRFIRIIKYWLKSISSNSFKFRKIVYSALKQDADTHPDKISWVTSVRDLLSRLGFRDVWLQQGVGDNDHFLSIFKQRLSGINLQNGRARVSNTSRSIIYKEIIDHGFQYFLKILSIPNYRVAMTRLILSSHNLNIESGRWQRPITSRENRKCTLCNKVEDEFHFIFECSAFVQLRKQYIKPYFWKRPSMTKMIELFKVQNVKTFKNLSVYIFKAFEIRKSM